MKYFKDKYEETVPPPGKPKPPPPDNDQESGFVFNSIGFDKFKLI